MSMTSDLKLYRELSQPFESMEALQTAIYGFDADIEAARKKWRIANVAIVALVNVADGDEESSRLSCRFWGDRNNEVLLLAYALGQAQKDREALVGRALKGK